MAYDFEGARAAGGTDEQIAGYLASKHNYDLDSAIKAGGSYKQVLEYLATKEAPIVKQEPQKESGDFMRGAGEAFQQIPQLGYGLVAGAGAVAEKAFGEGGIATGIKKAGVEGYQRWGEKVSEGAKETDSWSTSYERAKEGDFASLVDWFQHGLGYAAGQGVQILATGGLGALAAKGAGVGAIRMAEGMVAKESAKIAATKEGAALSADQIAKMATANVASKIGQNTALAATAFGMEGGEIYGDLVSEASKAGRELSGSDLGKAFVATAAAGGLEFVGDRLGLDLMLGKKILGMTIPSSRVARGLTGATTGIVGEGLTEYGQTLIEEAGKGKDPFSQESLRNALDAAALGALGGGAMGGVGGIISKPIPSPTIPDEILTAPDVDTSIQNFTDYLDSSELLDETTAITSQEAAQHIVTQEPSLTPIQPIQEAANVIPEAPTNIQPDQRIELPSGVEIRPATGIGAGIEPELGRTAIVDGGLVTGETQPIGVSEGEPVQPVARAAGTAVDQRLIPLSKRKEIKDAETIRSDEGQIRKGSEEGQPGIRPGAGEGGGYIQQPTPEKPGIEQTGRVDKREEEITKGEQYDLQKQEAKAAEAVKPENAPASKAGTIKVLSDGRYAAVGFTPEQIKSADPKAFIDGKGTGIFSAKINKIQLERALGISTLPQDAILAEGDKPYKNQSSALMDRKARRLNKTHIAQKIEGGFALVPKEKKNVEAKRETIEQAEKIDIAAVGKEVLPDIQQEGKGGEGFALEQQTEAELAQREAAQREAEQRQRDEEAQARKAQAEKDQADIDVRIKARAAKPENFQFGESSRDAAAPVADLFSQPAKPGTSSTDAEIFEREMRAAASSTRTAEADIQTTALRYVQFDKALDIAKRAVSAGVRAVPAQFHTRLDVTMESADRLISALETSSAQAGNVKPSSQSKKLEVIKAQAQGKITGDQGAALKELADAGENAAVDEVLKPAEVKTTPPVISEKPEKLKQAEKPEEITQTDIDKTGGILFSKKSAAQIANPHTVESAQEAILSAHTGKIKGAIKAMFDAGKARSITAQQAAAIVGDDALFAKSEQTETEAFRRWFGDSKVVDAEGKPLVVYHGTTHTNIESFMPKDIDGNLSQDVLDFYKKAKENDERFGYMGFRSGTFFSPNSAYAGNYTGENKGVMYPVYIKASNPIYFDQKTKKVTGVDPNKTPDALIMVDGDTINEIAVIDPTQVKSAIGNSGAFDPANPDIRYSNDGRAVAFFNPADGVTYFIADHLSKSASAQGLRGLAAHEIGVHALHLGRDSKEFQSILKQLELLRKSGNKAAVEAFNRVPEGTPAWHVNEEALAYLVQKSPDLPISKRLIAWFRNALREIGKRLPVMQRMSFMEWAASLTESDIIFMAQDAMARWSPAEKEIAAQSSEVLASREMQSAESFARMYMEEFAAENEQAFSIPDTKSRSIPNAIQDVIDDVKYLGEITQDDEHVQSGADRVYAFRTAYNEDFKVYEADDGRVWINVADLTKGTGGQMVYSAIADYAYNTKKKFIGDPYGLTMDSIIRRTVNMLTSALKHGTTRHLEPAKQQEWGQPEDGVEPLEWSGSDIDKTESLIHTFLATMQNLAPQIKEYSYDFQSQQFTDGQGRPVDGDAISEALPRAARAGEKTARRAVFLQSLLSEAGKGVERRSQLLEQLLRWGSSSSPKSLDKLFSKATDDIALTYPGAKPPAQSPRQGKIPLQGVQYGNRASWDSPEPSFFDDMVYKLQNKNIDLKRVVQAIRDSGTQLAEKWDAYLQEELFHGRAAKRVQDFVNTELKPMMMEMKARGLKLGELDEYLHARHAKEANALIAQRDPNMPDGGSGMTDKQADDYFANLPPEKRTKLEATAKRVDSIISKTRDYYVSYGLISKDQADSWAQMFKHYVPLMREDHDGGMGIGQGFSIKGKEVKHRTGSTAKVVDILANIAMQREKAIVRGEKNRVAVSLAGLAKLNPNPDFWTFDKPPIERVLNENTGLVEERINPMFKSRDNVVVAKIKDANGQVHERAIIFNEQNERAVRMAEAIKNLDASQLNGVLAMSAKITRYFASINTQYNPVFGLTNLVRDVQGAALNLTSTPLANHKKEVISHILSAAKGIYLDARAERKGAPATSKWAALWEELQDEGGMTGYRDLYRTSADRAKAIEDELDPHNWVNNKLGKVFTANGTLKVPLTKAQDMAKPLFGWLSDYNLMMEGSTRLAIYKTAIDHGMSKQEAASLAKNTTVNFNRKGQAGQQAGALYAFFNAAMQGTARIGQTIFDMDKGDIKTLRLSKTGKAIVTGGVMLGVMQTFALAMAGFDDDEPPEFIRERNIIIPIGGSRYITIPMPLGFHVFPNLGRIPTEFALGGFKNPAEQIVKLMGVFAEAFNPIGSSGISMQTIAPTAIDPFAALAENRDWTGKPIYKEDFSSMKPTPGFTRNKDTASSWAKFIAEGINYLSGGDEYAPGVFSPTADQIDYLFGQVTGGVGREISKVSQTVGAGFSGEELPTYKVPLVGRFYGSAESQSSQGNAYYSNLKEINLIEMGLKGRREDGLPTDEFKRDNPKWKLIARAKYADNVISKLRKRKRNLVENDAPREQVRQIEERITAEMLRFNTAVDSFESRTE